MNHEPLPEQDPVDVTIGRGRYRGAAYIARRKCGKVSAMCWDDAGSEKDTAKHVASYIMRGDSVERVERYENDPMPEWICRNGCMDCVTPNVKAIPRQHAPHGNSNSSAGA